MGRWVKLDLKTKVKILKAKAEGYSWNSIRNRFGVSTWTTEKLRRELTEVKDVPKGKDHQKKKAKV